MGQQKSREVRNRSQSRVEVQGGNLLKDVPHGHKRLLQLARRANVKKATIGNVKVKFERKGVNVVAVVG